MGPSPARGVPAIAGRRSRHARRGGWAQAERRRTSAGRHRPRLPEGRADPHPRRSDGESRRGDRSRGPREGPGLREEQDPARHLASPCPARARRPCDHAAGPRPRGSCRGQAFGRGGEPMPEDMNLEIAHKLSEPDEREAREKRHWEEFVEIVEVIILAIVAVATAWSGYQAARWDGRQGPP